MKNKLSAIVQVRLTSKRFPSKVLKTVGNLSIVELVIKRLERSKFINNIIVAIPNNKKNEPLEGFLLNRGFIVFKGSENDVLDRYYSAAKKFKLKNIIRITSDCPLVDPSVVDEIAKKYFDLKVDYLSNNNPATFPQGLDVEIFSFRSLKKAWELARSKYDREHVTPYIKRNKEIFKSSNVFNNKDLSKINLALDEPEDLIIIKKIFNFFKPDIYFNWKKIFTIRKLNKILF